MKARGFTRSHGGREISNDRLKKAACIVDEHFPEFDVYASLRADWHLLLAEQEGEEVEE